MCVLVCVCVCVRERKRERERERERVHLGTRGIQLGMGDKHELSSLESFEDGHACP